MSDSNEEGDNKKKDLTRIEDLSEFLHEDDPEADAFLTDGASDDEEPGEDAQDLDDLPDLPGDESSENEEQDFSADSNIDFDEDTSPNLQEQESFQEFDPFQSDDESGNEQQEEESENSFEENDDDIFGGGDDEQNQFGDQEEFSGLDDSPFSEDQDDQSFDEGDTTFDSNEDQAFGQDFEQDDDQNTEQDEEFESSHDDFDQQEDEQQQPTSQDNEEDSQEQEGAQVLEFEEPQSTSAESDETESQPSSQDKPEPQTQTPQKRENFQEVREFGTHMTYGQVAAGGNPPFSIAIRNIQYKEDAEDILALMREHGLLTDQNENQMRQSVEMGALLISQISEYSAIYLGHKLRRFAVNLQIGPAEEVHPPKSYTNEDVGLSSKSGLRKGRAEGLKISTKGLSIDDIIVSTSEKLPGWKTVSYLGIITENAIIPESDIRNAMDLSNSQDIEEKAQEGFKDESLAMNHTYQNLLKELRKKALKQNANGILNVSFQLSPLMKKSTDDEVIYQVTCTGNLVQMQKQE